MTITAKVEAVGLVPAPQEEFLAVPVPEFTGPLFPETQEDLHRDYKVEMTRRDMGGARRGTRHRANEGWVYTTDVEGGEDGARTIFKVRADAPVRAGTNPYGSAVFAVWRLADEPDYEPEF